MGQGQGKMSMKRLDGEVRKPTTNTRCRGQDWSVQAVFSRGDSRRYPIRPWRDASSSCWLPLALYIWRVAGVGNVWETGPDPAESYFCCPRSRVIAL